ncbi:GPI anchored serine-threonine rich family protein [Aspergillus undulatus]|uniref:GPI anchored serine-threonine rich family protein n=1 Tax=Aspergillus undulatus TaxID=1810928 RepID=UPI003CCE2E61
MRFTLVSAVVPLAATVAAIQVTEPKKGAEIDPSDSFTVKWDSVSTDVSSFDLYLVNNAVYPPVDKKIASDVETSDGSYTVDGISGLEDGHGYQVNLFSNEEHNTGILAQSEQFNVTVSDSTSSTSSTTSTHTSTTSTSSSTSTTAATSASKSSSAAASASDASVSDTPDLNGAGVISAPMTALAGLIGGALLFTL